MSQLLAISPFSPVLTAVLLGGLFCILSGILAVSVDLACNAKEPFRRSCFNAGCVATFSGVWLAMKIPVKSLRFAGLVTLGPVMAMISLPVSVPMFIASGVAELWHVS